MAPAGGTAATGQSLVGGKAGPHSSSRAAAPCHRSSYAKACTSSGLPAKESSHGWYHSAHLEARPPWQPELMGWRQGLRQCRCRCCQGQGRLGGRRARGRRGGGGHHSDWVGQSHRCRCVMRAITKRPDTRLLRITGHPERTGSAQRRQRPPSSRPPTHASQARVAVHLTYRSRVQTSTLGRWMAAVPLQQLRGQQERGSGRACGHGRLWAWMAQHVFSLSGEGAASSSPWSASPASVPPSPNRRSVCACHSLGCLATSRKPRLQRLSACSSLPASPCSNSAVIKSTSLGSSSLQASCSSPLSLVPGLVDLVFLRFPPSHPLPRFWIAWSKRSDMMCEHWPRQQGSVVVPVVCKSL